MLVDFNKVWAALLPSGEAWRIANPAKNLSKYWAAISAEYSELQAFANRALVDQVDPVKTDDLLEEYESMWGLSPLGLTDKQRREQLVGTIFAIGGQSPRYLSDVLRVLLDNPNITVYDWWEDETTSPVTPRNPFEYITFEQVSKMWGGGNPDTLHSMAWGDGSVWGEDITDLFPAKPFKNYLQKTITDGNAAWGDGGMWGDERLWGQYDGFRNVITDDFQVPTDPITWKSYWYLCGANFGDIILIPRAQERILKEALDKYFPAQLWGVTFLAYEED